MQGNQSLQAFLLLPFCWFNFGLLAFLCNTIQASTKGKNIQSFAASIIEGDYYQISEVLYL
uniref:Uncharacterized protein n=1 Tax=Salix viminalis TaxID=40686 RepID=A0A6N2KD67_SALVM